MKISLKRIMAYALVFVMVLGMLPTMAANHVHAATSLTTSVTGLTASWEYNSTNQNGSYVASKNTITGTATGGKLNTTTTVLTMTNDLGEEATLKFSWELSGYYDGVIIDSYPTLSGAISASSPTSGSYEGILANGAAITITFKSPKNATSTLAITNISLISTTAADPTITFKPGANGTYTVDGTAVTAETAMTVAAGTELALVAAPASGYQFYGWQKVDGTYLSQDASFTLTAGEDLTVTPVFISSSVALFGVGTAKYDDLTEAGKAAAAGTTKTIILLNNGTVSGSHTIPAGTTLLIPYDNANTAYGSNPNCTSDTSKIPMMDTQVDWVTPSAYRTLTLAADANITVNGNIEVGGRHAAAGGKLGKYGGSPTDKLGYVNMLAGSHIDLNSGANLYCWGYIYGDGTITAKSGASIYENFQIMDFRGGSVTSSLAAELFVFPLSQYYVQNVEVATRYEYGATEWVATSIFMSNACNSATVKFIGEGAMFQPAEGSYFIKDYNPATDRLEMHAYGDSALASMNLELGTTAVNSADFVLPITNNIEIHLHSGTTTLKQNMMMLPGSSLTIDQGATLNLAYTDVTGDVVTAGGYVIQIFDSENWTTGLNMDTLETETGLLYVHPSKQFTPLEYICTSHKTRTTADLTDVTIDINGQIITDGFMYSTVTWKDAPNEDFTIVSGGANVISSGKTGVVAMNNGAGQDMMGYLYAQSKSAYYIIPLASVQLKNGDGTLLDTTTATAGTTYNYCATHDCWYTGECAKCALPATVEITWIVNGVDSSQEVDYNTVPVYGNGTNPTKAYDATNHYSFAGWATTEGGTVLSALPAATADATYYAVFTPTAHSGTDDGNCLTAVTCSCGYVITAAENAHVDGDDNDHDCDNCDATNVDGGHHGGTATCMAQAVCEECGQSYGDKNAANHTKQNTTVKDAVTETCGKDGYTGDTYCECGEKIATGTVIFATGKHSDKTGDNDHNCDVCTAPNVTKCSGGTATCQNQAICTECSQPYGQLDANNHASPDYTYVNNNNGTHTKKHACCSAVVKTEGHTYVNGHCDCEAVQTFTVTWVDAAGKAVDSETVTYGGNATKTPAVPAKDGYNGVWSGTATNVTSDVTITPDYTLKSYQISFDTDGDGDVDYSASFNHFSKLAMAAPVLPENTAQYTYAFDCWKDQNGNVVDTNTVVTGEMTVTMYYTTTVNTYTVTWIVDGNTTTESYKYGDVPSFKGSTDKAQVGCTTYTFSDWDKELAPVTGDATYTAQYSSETNHDWVDADCENDGYCNNCGAVGDAATGHTPGAAATCTTAQTCTVCGEVLAEKNMNAHVASSTISVDNKDGKTHTVKWPCCGTVVNATEAHSYTNGVCACTAEQSVGITYHSNGGSMYVNDEYYGEDVFYTFTYTWGKSVAVKADEVNGHEFYVYYAGKQFAGWNTKADGTGTAYAIGETITLTENITLYAQYKDIAVDGVALNSGEYLDCNGNVTTTKPDGGYAYYANGILTLHNFVGTGGVHATNATTQETGVYYEGSLTMVLEGDNSLSGVYNGIYCYDLTIRGEGSLTITSEYTAIKSDAVTIESGNITLTGEHALSVNDDITITGGTVTGTGYLNSYSGGLILDGVIVRTPAGTTFGSCWSSNYLLGSDGEPVTSFVIGACEHAEKTCTDLENGFHKVTCDTCGKTVAESKAHDYTYDFWNHKCECGAVEEFKLTVVYGLNGEYTYEAMVPYGTKFATLDIFKNWQWTIYVNEADRIGTYDFYDFYVGTSADDLMWDRYFIEGGMHRDIYVDATRYDFTGFVNDGNGWQIMKSGNLLKDEMIIFTMSDLYENGSEEELEGVYMADANGYRIENALGRWYYVGECPFNGVIYEPNAEDLAYCESKGTTFIDAEKTWYYFGADGKWQYNYTGLVGDSYVVNGQAAWHVGLVQIGEDYYYFKGNASVGGNIMVSGGDYYLNRNNTELNVTVGGIYTFDNDGKLRRFHGITENDLFEGKRYYVGGRLMIGAGLQDIDTAATGITNYFYVDSYGQLILDAEYYIGANNLGIPKGIYYFDTEGFLVMPEEEPGKSGFYYEDGNWFYYVDGAKAYCAGLISTSGILWFETADAEGVENQGWVYVKSNGALATGAYYVTNVNNHATIVSGDLCVFGADCLMQTEKNGIVDGYYYQNDKIVYGAGLIQIDGSYYYVRSNGQVVMDRSYWITNVGDTYVVAKQYTFGADGTFTPEFTQDLKNGIVDGYYYENGKIVYGKGLIELDGSYYYVRSNGQVVMNRSYWITTTNGLKDAGVYTFDADGKMIVE